MHSVRCSSLAKMHIQAIIFLVLLAAGTISAQMMMPSAAVLANYHGNRIQPINIQTSKTHKAGMPLIRSGEGAGEKALLINTGKSVEVRLVEDKTDLFLTGETVGNYLYVYTRTIFYWAEEATGTAGTLVDGKKSTALEVSQLYYNTKYRSYTESLTKSDGVVDVRMRFRTDAEKDNPKFKPFQEKLEEIRNPGSTSVEMEKHNSWYLDFKPAASFANPGSVTNVTAPSPMEKTYNCTITVINRDIFSVSENQFEAFTNIETNEDTKLITKQKTQDQGDRPVIQTDQMLFVRSNIPFGKLSSFS